MAVSYSDICPDPWLACRGWVTIWDGMATEVFILDFGRDMLDSLASEILDRTELLSFVGISDQGKIVPETLHEAMTRLEAGRFEPVIVDLDFGPIEFQFYLWAGRGDYLYLSMVFWANQVFPDGRDTSLDSIRFRQIIQLALDLCDAVEARKVILTGEWNASPYLLEAPENASRAYVVWQR